MKDIIKFKASDAVAEEKSYKKMTIKYYEFLMVSLACFGMVLALPFSK